jgi:hypothetical protein
VASLTELASSPDVLSPNLCDDLRPWLHPALYRATSPIHGAGVFTAEALAGGEPVVRWRGTIVPGTNQAIARIPGEQHSAVSIAEGVLLASLPGRGLTIDDYMNHNCVPNVGMADAVTLIALRDIAPREELTADYAFWTANEDDVVIGRCACGSPGCRERVTGRDWRDPALQNALGEFFAPFIKRRIAKLLSLEVG